MKKINHIMTEVLGWFFLILSILTVGTVLVTFNDQPAMLIGAVSCIGIFFAVLGFGFLFLDRIEHIKSSMEGTKAEPMERSEELQQKNDNKKRNWMIIGIVAVIILIVIALIPVFL